MNRFPPQVTAEIDATKYMKIRAGDHRYIHVWVVVVDGRVVVRSWNDKPDGWYRAFLNDPAGAIQLGGADVPIRAIRVRSAKLNDAADAAYALKYATKANQPYVKGLATAARKATSLELLPADARRR
jgi:hypothetical protein